MTPINKAQKILFIAILIPFILMAFVFATLKTYVKEKYNNVILDTEIVQALTSDRHDQVLGALEKHNLGYQYINNGYVVLASNPELPRPDVISLSTTTLNKVIKQNPEDMLSQTLPYLTWFDGKMYLISVLATKLDSNDYYLVYSQLF